jgi:predicted kinase
MIIIVFGLPGSGKTYFALRLAERLKGIHISSDVIRAEISEQNNYSPQVKMRVYEKMLEEMEEKRNDKVIVLDATFYLEKIRKDFVKAAAGLNKKIYFIEVKADEEIIKERVSKKRKYSEADFEVYLKMKKAFEPLKEEHAILFSDKMSIEQMLDIAVRYLKSN